MADEKAFSNGRITVWVVLKSAITDLAKIDASVINSQGVNISSAISWSDTTLPHATESEDIDDRSIMDKGNATSRGANNYEATLAMFYPKNIEDPTSVYKKAWDLFSQTRHRYVLVVRVLQNKAGEKAEAKSGEWYSAFDFINSTYRNNTEGDDSVKYTVSFLAQGAVRVNGMFTGGSAAAKIEPAEETLTAGAHKALRATAYGHRVNSIVEWKSDHPEFATVSSNGVVTANKAGKANITFTDPATGESAACAVTVS